jgi:FKBP-type peptidyl-prolyl cis-trans isomerase
VLHIYLIHRVMGRRKRYRDDEFDDTVERTYFGQISKEDEIEALNAEKGDKIPDDDASQIERNREKKRLKKQRQREKKEALKKEEEKSKAAKEKIEQEKVKTREEKLERKKLEKKAPDEDKFITTHKGVKYCDVLVGKGPVIEDRKKVTVKYILRSKSKQGKVLDSGSNFSFKMGKGEVIPGWEIGLLRMKQGGIRHIIVPPAAGYGNKDIGGGKGVDLYFEVTLLKC